MACISILDGRTAPRTGAMDTFRSGSGGGGGGGGGGRATSLREWKHNNNVYQYDYTGAQTVEVMIHWTVQIFNAMRRKVLLMSLMSIYKCEDSNRNCIRYDIRFIKATARIVFRKHV